MLPLPPETPASVVLTSIFPLDNAALAPLVTEIEPPTNAPPLPAATVIEPPAPAPATDDPDMMDTLPAFLPSPAESPALKIRLPPVSTLLAPTDTCTRPASPAAELPVLTVI